MTERGTFGDRYRARMHRVGLLWNRLIGTFLVVIGGYAALLSVGSDNFSLATHWPTFVVVGGLLWLARWFFKAGDVVIEPFETDGDALAGEKPYPLEWLDRGLGMVVARIAGTIAVLGGAGAAWSVLTLEDFNLGTYWPVLAISGVLLLAGRACFRGRPSFLDMMSETPLSPSEAAARRRNMAIDDQRGSEHQRRDRDERSEIG